MMVMVIWNDGDYEGDGGSACDGGDGGVMMWKWCISDGGDQGEW